MVELDISHGSSGGRSAAEAPTPAPTSAPGAQSSEVGVSDEASPTSATPDTTAAGMPEPRTALVFYPADAGAPGQYPRVEGYSTVDALPEVLHPVLPAEYIQMVKLDLLSGPPANREGPFPVVIHSHDAGSAQLFEARHLQHLASWGFVVAAPDHQERSLAALFLPPGDTLSKPDQDLADLRNTRGALQAQNLSEGGPLKGALNLDLVAAEGHGAGARSALLVAEEPSIKTVIALAPHPPIAGADATPFPPPVLLPDAIRQELAELPPPEDPLLIVASDKDGLVPLAAVEAEAEWASREVPGADGPSSAMFAVLDNAGHQTYLDLCAPIRARGGLSQHAGRYPALAGLFSSSEDGCAPDNLDPDRGYAVVNHMSVAHLRWVFRFDEGRASLDPEFLAKTFPGVLESATYRGAQTP